MQVSVETTSNIERRVTIAVPADVVDAKVNEKLNEVAKTARLNGFRAGKVPLKVVTRQYGQSVRQEVAGDIINSSYAEAIEKEDVKPAGYPKIEINTLESGKDLEYVATVEVYPEVDLDDFSTYNIERVVGELGDQDIDNAIVRLREQKATFTGVDRAAANGDQVTIDFVGAKDGEEFDGGKAEGHLLVLGSNSMIPGFEEGIEGMLTGDQKTISLTFPEDYQVEELKGAETEFTITLHKVEEKHLPELTEEFIKEYGVDDLDAFNTDVRKNMEKDLKDSLKAKTKTNVMDALLAGHEITLPKALIASEIETLREQMMQQFGGIQRNDNLDLKSLLPDSMFTEKAERRVALGLIVGEIVKVNELKVDDQQVRDFIEQSASNYDKPEEFINYYYENEQLLASVESMVLEDVVVDYILSQAQVFEKNVTYDELKSDS